MRRTQGSDEPLRHRQHGIAGQADLAIGPGLLVSPLDQVVFVFRLLPSPGVDVAFGITGTAAVRCDHHIAMGHPIGGCRGFELVEPILPCDGHIHARRMPEEIVVQHATALAVGAPADNGWILSLFDRPIQIRPDLHAVAQCYGHIPFHQHIRLQRHAAFAVGAALFENETALIHPIIGGVLINHRFSENNVDTV